MNSPNLSKLHESLGDAFPFTKHGEIMHHFWNPLVFTHQNGWTKKTPQARHADGAPWRLYAADLGRWTTKTVEIYDEMIWNLQKIVVEYSRRFCVDLWISGIRGSSGQPSTQRQGFTSTQPRGIQRRKSNNGSSDQRRNFRTWAQLVDKLNITKPVGMSGNFWQFSEALLESGSKDENMMGSQTNAQYIGLIMINCDEFDLIMDGVSTINNYGIGRI